MNFKRFIQMHSNILLFDVYGRQIEEQYTSGIFYICCKFRKVETINYAA